MARHANDFQTIRSEGGLLPSDLLRRLLDPKERLDGTRPEDYGLPQGERLNEIIIQSWNRLRKHWAEFRAAAVNLPEGEAGTGLTNDKLSLPLLRELGFGLLPTSAGPEVGGRTYAISRFFGPVPVHLIGCGLNLDRRAAGVRGAAAVNPHGLVQEFLNRSPKHLWGIVANGLGLRILRDSQALSRQSFLEFDLEAIFAGEVYSDFVLLWLVAHATRFAAREADRPDTCWLEQWTKLANEQGTRALGDLRGGVEKALQVLGEGLTGHPRNTVLRDALRTGQVPLADFHGQLLRVVYRLIFLFVAEDRKIDGQSLLHPREDGEQARLARDRYAAHYSAVRLRELASEIKGSRHGDLWRQFQILVGALSGDTRSAAVRMHLALPALGSFFWDPTSTAVLNDAELTNHDFLEALRHLAFSRQGKVLRPVDYKNLGAEELGGVYESLLALTPQVSADGARFNFAEFAGNERKTSGSYYTPDALVQCLLDSALDPVVENAIKGRTGADAQKAILDLKVCDPAVGSGHFLVGAAHRMARHLARVRALALGESEPSPLLYQHALREVIGRCLYGVDLNPMASELCRVSLWLEALEPGKPLAFLDHHIRVGNSLLGTTPELIAAGLPDEAFTAIEGDDKKVCATLKKRNKQEREGQRDMLHLMVAEPEADYNSIATRSRGVDEASDETINELQRKAELFHGLLVSPQYQHAQLVADAWCAAFVWEKEANTSLEPITTDTIRRLGADPNALTPTQAREVERLSSQYQFFHWHLVFPEVFSRGGFDVILGNPPWDRVQVEEKQFFSASRPHIAAARSKDRELLIDALKDEAPHLFLEWKDACRLGHGQSHLLKSSGCFPNAGQGNVNTFALFAELAANLVRQSGRAGLILPSGVITEASSQDLFRWWLQNRRLIRGLDFENSAGLFPDVHRSFRFCLLTLCGVDAGPERPAFSFFLTDVAEIRDETRQLSLGRADLLLLNPSSLTCPPIRSRRDAELLLRVHRRYGIFIGGDSNEQNPWAADSRQMLNSSHDSESFIELPSAVVARMDTRGRVATDTNTLVRLYDGKMVDQFDHRLASTGHNVSTVFRTTSSERTDPSDHARPDFLVTPQYWVALSKVSPLVPDSCIKRGWWLGFRAVTASTNWRTMVASVIPLCGQVHSLPALYSTLSAADNGALLGCLNSVVLDYCARLKLSGTHLSHFVIKQLPVPPPTTFSGVCEWCVERQRVQDWLLPRVLELTYTAWDVEPFAQDCGWSGPPFRWDEERRFLLRCELDAAFFHLYLPAETSGAWRLARGETPEDLARLKQGFPTPREAVSYIMDTFPIVRRKDEEEYDGDYRTKRVILDIYDAMQESIRTGKPYQTRLEPPAADPRCCHPPREVTKA